MTSILNLGIPPSKIQLIEPGEDLTTIVADLKPGSVVTVQMNENGSLSIVESATADNCEISVGMVDENGPVFPDDHNDGPITPANTGSVEPPYNIPVPPPINPIFQALNAMQNQFESPSLFEINREYNKEDDE